MNERVEGDANRDEKHIRALLLQKRRRRLTEENLPKILVSRDWEKRLISKQKIFEGKFADPSFDFWRPSVYENYKSVSGCKFDDQYLFERSETVRQSI